MPNLAGALPRAEKTLEMLVECGPEQLVIHPGGLRLKLSDVKTNENLLISQLEQAVFSARVDDPTTDWKPTVRFLIKPEGQQTFWIARRQMLVGGLNWPVTLQVADAEVRRLLDTETPR